MDWADPAAGLGPGPDPNLTSPGPNLSLSNGTAEADWTDEAALAAAVQFRDASRFWVQRVLVPAVVTVGVLGNLVTVVVLTRRRMRSSTNMYLTALAASDLLYLVFMFTMSLEYYPGFHGPAYRCYWEYKPFGLWFTDATSSSSIWLTVSFTVERYIAVCHPLRGRRLCTESRARAVIAGVFVLCALATVTTPFEWRVLEAGSPPRLSLGETPFGAHELYRTVFYWFSSITFMILPLTLLGIFNSFLVRAVHRSQRQRCRMTQVDQHESSSSTQTQENRITIVLIAVVVLFMLCHLPTAVILIYTSLYPLGQFGDQVVRGLGNICNFLVAIHSSCNFLLYCALSDKYRRTFLLTFFPRCAPPGPGPGAVSCTGVSSAYPAGPGGRFSASLRGPPPPAAGPGPPGRGYSLRVHPASANGAGPLKRHVSAYIPRPRGPAAAAAAPQQPPTITELP